MKRFLTSPLFVGAVVAVGLALLVVGPALGGGRLLGHENLDNWSHAWGMHWFSTELMSGNLPWDVHGAAYPESRVLWYVDPMGALLVTPLQAFGPDIAYNALALLQVGIAAFCGWGFGRALGGRGWVAAAGVATMPLLQTELHNGVVEAAWVGLIAGAGWLAARGSRWTGVVVGLVGIASPYHGLGAGVLAGVLLLSGEGTWKKRALLCGLAAVVSIVVVLPHATMLARGFQSTEPFVLRPLWNGLNDPSMRVNATDWMAYLRPGDFWSLAPSDALGAVPWKHTPYLGWLLLVGAVVAWVRAPRLRWLLVPFTFSVVISLGSFLWHDEAWVTTANGSRYKLPLGFLSEWFHLELTHHMRFVGMACVVLAGLADRASGRWGPLLAVGVCLENLVVAPNCWPPPSSDAAVPAVYAQVDAPVLDLPAARGESNATNRYLYWQAVHGQPVPWNNKVGMTGYINPTLKSWVDLSRAGHVGTDEGLDELSEHFGYVVLHPDLVERVDILSRHRRVLDATLGQPTEVDGALLYRLR
jgi:hypothetical protein